MTLFSKQLNDKQLGGSIHLMENRKIVTFSAFTEPCNSTLCFLVIKKSSIIPTKSQYKTKSNSLFFNFSSQCSHTIPIQQQMKNYDMIFCILQYSVTYFKIQSTFSDSVALELRVPPVSFL